jgi:hypothetical protein
MDVINVDGVSVEVSDLRCTPFPTEGLVKEVRFRIAEPAARRPADANHYVPLEFSIGARRYEGLLRLVSAAQVRFATEYVYAGSARAMNAPTAEVSAPPQDAESV